MVTNALRTVLVASLALSTDAFIVSSPALARSRLQRPSASSTPARSARVKTGVLRLQASNFDGTIGKRPDPQVRALYTFSFLISLRAPAARVLQPGQCRLCTSAVCRCISNLNRGVKCERVVAYHVIHYRIFARCAVL